jgi:anti-sigma B factor antagonist
MIFKYNSSELGNIKLLILQGELIDREQPADMVRAVIEDISNGKNLILMDMENLKYINSSGLSVIINILTKARKAGGDVAICSVTPKVAELLVITKLDSIFNICKTRDQAAAILNNL